MVIGFILNQHSLPVKPDTGFAYVHLSLRIRSLGRQEYRGQVIARATFYVRTLLGKVPQLKTLLLEGFSELG